METIASSLMKQFEGISGMTLIHSVDAWAYNVTGDLEIGYTVYFRDSRLFVRGEEVKVIELAATCVK